MNESGDVDYKADHKFADLMPASNEAVSDFAKRRTISQQRQYLPIFAVRNEVSFSKIISFDFFECIYSCG